MSEATASILAAVLYAIAGGLFLWAVLGQRIVVRVKRLRR